MVETRLESPARPESARAVSRRQRIGLRATGMLLTPEEFDAIPEGAWDDRFRYELIHGVLVVSPIPLSSERDPNEELGYLLRLYRDTHPQGAALNKTLWEETIVTPTQRRRADRVIWAGLGRVPDPERDFPAIIVEFVSQSRADHRRDYAEKRVEYLAAGVREYWIIDRFQRIMSVCRNEPAGVATLVIPEGDTYQTELLPGFVLPPARLFAQADDWPPKRRKPRRTPPPPAGGTDG